MQPNEIIQSAIKSLGTRAVNQPAVPFIPQTSLKSLFTRPPSGLDPGSMFGAFQQDPKQAMMDSVMALSSGAPKLNPIYGMIEDIPIKRQLGLKAEESAVEGKFAKEVMGNLESMYVKAKEKFGNVINTDNMRELSSDYAASKESRSSLSRAVHEPASAMAKYSYKKALVDPKADTIYGTAGGTGSGKSTGSTQLEKVLDGTAYLYDTNMNTFSSAKEKIEQAIKAGKKFDLKYTFADPIASLDRALGRAERMGRTVPIDEHLKTHVGALDTIKKLYKQYKSNPNVKISVIDNTGPKGGAKEVAFDALDNLSYNTGELEKALKNRLNMLYETGQISDNIFRGTAGK